MIRVRRARRIAVAAAYGGGGAGAVGAAVFGLLATQAKIARRTIGLPTAQPPAASGWYGTGSGEELRVAFLGDSTAAGLGVHRPQETPGAVLAAGLARLSGRAVRLTNVAVTGARSTDLERQVQLALEDRPHVAVIMIGANDVTHRVRPSTSVRLLEQAVRRLRAADVEVVVGTCPDLGTIEPIAQPLRWVARRWSRQLAAAQTIAVVEAGGRTVSLGDVLAPEFAARPSEMFGPDRFHPSAAGYGSAASALLPSACAAIGCSAEVEAPPDVRRGEGLRSVAVAAVEAAERPGTEVSGAQVAGRERGPRGRWALLRHRNSPELSAAGPPDERRFTGEDGQARP
ncbi:MAG: SGNH/GDSL hydrolase family protein [Actinomycetota bacterium]|nr:SGNH/GDSL hydrolase family protein [Actinomycetota bacterium]